MGLVATLVLLIGLAPGLAGAETLGLASFSGPSGWVRKARPNVVSFEKVYASQGTWGVITFYRDVPGTGNPIRDFSAQWTELLGSKFGAGEPEEVETKDHPAGYVLKVGGARVRTEAGDSAAILIIASGYGRVISSLFLTNSNDLVPSFDRFIDGVTLNKPSGSSAAPAGSNGVGNAALSPSASGGGGVKPGELVGSWVNGSVSGPALYNSVTGVFQTYATGKGHYLELLPNGKAHMLAMLENTMGTCKNRVHTARDGTWSASGGVLHFNFTSGAGESDFCGKKRKNVPQLGREDVPYRLYEFEGRPAISLDPDKESARSLYKR